jgi:hypothetical protein
MPVYEIIPLVQQSVPIPSTGQQFVPIPSTGQQFIFDVSPP